MAGLRTTVGRLRTVLGLAWRGGRWKLLGLTLAQVAAGAVPVVNTWLLKVALDNLVGDRSGMNALAFGAAFASLTFAGAVLSPILRYLEAELGRSVAVQAKDRLYAAVDRLDLLTTLEEPHFRDRLRLAAQASQQGPSQVVGSILGCGRASITLLGMLGTVALVHPYLALVLVASGLPAVAAEMRLSRGRAGLLWRISPAERREAFFTELLTSINAAKEIRLFGTGRLFHRRMLNELSASNAERHRQDQRELMSHCMLAALSAALAGGALLWLLVDAGRGQVTVGGVGATVMAVSTALNSVAAIVSQIGVGHNASIVLDHYRELVDAAPDAPAPRVTGRRYAGHGGQVGHSGHAGHGRLAGHTGIELVDVWFRYGDGQPWVLRGLSLVIPHGKAVAIVGENGTGKSTLVKLLCRFYDPTKGMILWDGVDIRDIPVAELRSRIGAVFQDFMSYELTAAENIALGAVDGRDEIEADEERIVDAARRADILDTLRNLPLGPKTLLSRTFVDYADADADGVLLSGGQWQRLALARALFRGQRELLILDEPSSGLDAVAEHRIHRQLAVERRGRTSLLISHRLGTIRDANEILVLFDGKVGERGTHRELLAEDGVYARLFKLQAAGYEVERDAGEVLPVTGDLV